MEKEALAPSRDELGFRNHDARPVQADLTSADICCGCVCSAADVWICRQAVCSYPWSRLPLSDFCIALAPLAQKWVEQAGLKQ